MASLKKTKRIEIEGFPGEYITVKGLSMGTGMRLNELRSELPFVETEDGEIEVNEKDPNYNKVINELSLYIHSVMKEVLIDWSFTNENGEKLSREDAIKELDSFLVMLSIMGQLFSFFLGSEEKLEKKGKQVKNLQKPSSNMEEPIQV